MTKKPLKLNLKKKPLKLDLKKKPLKLNLKEKAGDSGEPKPEATPVLSAQKLALPPQGGVQIILKNARIHAEKVIIKKAEKT